MMTIPEPPAPPPISSGSVPPPPPPVLASPAVAFACAPKVVDDV